MIRATINNSGIHNEERKLDIKRMYYGDSTDSIIVESHSHALKPDDVITFNENDEDQRYFTETRTVLSVIDEDHFTIDSFPDRRIYPVSASTAETTCNVQMSEDNKPIITTVNYVKLTFSNIFPHNFTKCRNEYNVVDNIDNLYYYGKLDKYKRMCVGDYILCDRFLYKSNGMAENHKLTIPSDVNEILNIKDKYIYYVGDYSERVYLGGEDLFTVCSGDTCVAVPSLSGDTEKITENINGVLITPLNYYGHDDIYELFWVFDKENDEHNEIVKYLLDNFATTEFFCKDERFFTEKYGWIGANDIFVDRNNLYEKDITGATIEEINENYPVKWYNRGKQFRVNDPCTDICICDCVELVLNEKETCEGIVPTANVTRNYGFFDLMLPISDDFGIDTYRNELLNDMLVSQEAGNSINDIIDYERAQFVPMFAEYDENNNVVFKPLSKINFKLHFRARPYEYEEGIGRDYGEFETSDSYYWNTATMIQDGSDFVFTADSFDSDLLGDIGFTDDDVYYQKKKLKNTFIRISCYDTRYRSTQSLLGYSTIFLDSGKYYKKYTTALANDENIKEGTIVYTDNIEDYRLGTEFECTSKYDREMSSDGFYIYTYPTIVNGTEPRTAYLKVEFNHAKYGKTIPMSYPTYSEGSDEHISGDPILRGNGGLPNEFPINYRKYGDAISGITGDTSQIIDIDTKKVFENSYIKIQLKYDDVTNQYIWYVVNNEGVTPSSIINGSEMTIIMWEPRLNGILQEENRISNNNSDDNG